MEINIPKPGILPLHENIANKKKKGEKKGVSVHCEPMVTWE
jgi:hypothetical protein